MLQDEHMLCALSSRNETNSSCSQNKQMQSVLMILVNAMPGNQKSKGGLQMTIRDATIFSSEMAKKPEGQFGIVDPRKCACPE